MKAKLWKALALCLVLTCMLVVFASCGSSDDSTPSATTGPGTSLKETVTQNGITFTVNSDGATYGVSGFDKSTTAVVIPAALNGTSVTEIKGSAFSECTEVVSISIPSSVTKIEAGAFYRCLALEEITLPSALTELGNQAFAYCESLEGIVIPNGVTKIGASAFYGCLALEEITLPSALTEIDADAFGECKSLESVTVPSGVTKIGASAFYGCLALEEITLPNTLTELGNSAFEECSSLDGIVLPSGVTVIGDNLFRRCTDLDEVTLSSATEKIGTYAFYWCTDLKNITIPSSVTEIGQQAFDNCQSLVDVVIPNGVAKIQNYTFNGCCGLTRVVIGTGITEIGTGAFSDCVRLVEVRNLGTLALEKGATDNGSVAKYAKNIITGTEAPSKVTIADGFVTYSDNGVYSHLIRYIGDASEVVTPAGVVGLGDYAFYKLDGVSSITLGAEVVIVGAEAFTSCSDLTEIKVADGNTSFLAQDGVLYNHTATKLIKFPQAKNVLTVVIPSTVKTIEKKAFYENEYITGIVFPSSVTEIGESAFEGCSMLIFVLLGDGVASIGDYAFRDCYRLVCVCNLSSLTIEAGKTANGQIGVNALEILTDAEAVKLSTDEDGFVTYALSDSEVILVAYLGTERSITVPSAVTAINPYFLYENDSVVSVTIGESVTRIGKHAFSFGGTASVTFAEPDGWFSAIAIDATSGKEIPSADLSNPAKAAELLQVNYSYYWHKSE